MLSNSGCFFPKKVYTLRYDKHEINFFPPIKLENLIQVINNFFLFLSRIMVKLCCITISKCWLEYTVVYSHSKIELVNESELQNSWVIIHCCHRKITHRHWMYIVHSMAKIAWLQTTITTLFFKNLNIIFNQTISSRYYIVFNNFHQNHWNLDQRFLVMKWD